MPPPRPGPNESASAALARVAPLVSRWVERLLGEHAPPLTLAQYLALEELDGGEISAGQLARGAGVSRSAVSQLVACLDASGLVARQEAGPDRRLQPLRLSSDGKRVLRSARRLLRARFDSLLELPPNEADRLARTLGRVEGMLGGTTPPPRRPPPPGRGPRPVPPGLKR